MVREYRYFADGDQALIRVDTDAPMGSEAFFSAPAERYGDRGHHRRPHLRIIDGDVALGDGDRVGQLGLPNLWAGTRRKAVDWDMG
jgi:hypothetical protein